MVRSITAQPTSFSRLNACEGEISWSIRIASAACSSRSRRSSSRLPVPKYAALSNPARFCVNMPTTANPSVFASWRSSASEASNSRSLTLDNCTAATMARFDVWATSCVMGTEPISKADPRYRLPHQQPTGEILKFEANLAEVLLGFVIVEGSDDFLQRKTAVDNGLQTIGRYRPNHVLLILSAANGDPADTNLIRKQCGNRHFSRKNSQDAD